MPALYIGTESQRSAEALKKIGFRGSEKIVGMDFPHNILRSMKNIIMVALLGIAEVT